MQLKLGLELSQMLAWDSNQCGWDLSPVKTHGLPAKITHLILGLNEAQVLCVSVQEEFSERKVTGKK